MEQKEKPAAFILFLIGGVLFLHRIYLGEYKPTLIVAALVAFFWGGSALGVLQESLPLLVLFLIFVSGWFFAVLADGCRMEKLVDRANARLLEKWK